jgi:hypothetical protein
VFSNQEIEKIASLSPHQIAEWVLERAKERNISIRRQLPSEKFARAVSRLSDAETDLDQIEELLVALRRSQIITPFQRGLLQVNYLR